MHFGSFSYRSILQNKRINDNFNPESYDLWSVIDPLSYTPDATDCFGDYKFLWNLPNTDRYIPTQVYQDGSWTGYLDAQTRSGPFITSDGVITFRDHRVLRLVGDGNDAAYWHDTSTSLIASVAFRINEPFTTGSRYILCTNSSGNLYRGVRWYVNSSGQVGFSIREGNNASSVIFIGSSPQIVPGQIHIATVVKSLKTYTLYVDGVQSTSGSVVNDISGSAQSTVFVGANGTANPSSTSLLGSMGGLYIFLGSNLPNRVDLEAWMHSRFANNIWSEPPKTFNSIYHWTPRTVVTTNLETITVCGNHGDITSSLGAEGTPEDRVSYINTLEGHAAEFSGTHRLQEGGVVRNFHSPNTSNNPTGRVRLGFVFRAGGEDNKRVLFSNLNENNPSYGAEIFISHLNELAISLRNSTWGTDPEVAGTVYANTSLILPGELYTAVLDKNVSSYTWYLNGAASSTVSVSNLAFNAAQNSLMGVGATAGPTIGNPYIGRLGPIFIFEGDNMPSPEEMSSYLSQFSLSDV